jgi:hypothetical protein
VLVAALLAIATALRAAVLATRLRHERLTGAAATERVPGSAPPPPPPAAAPAPAPERARRGWRSRSARDERGPRTAGPATAPATEPTAAERPTVRVEPGESGVTGEPGLGEPHPTRVIERTDADLPTYHLYRPSTPPNQADPGTDR